MSPAPNRDVAFASIGTSMQHHGIFVLTIHAHSRGFSARALRHTDHDYALAMTVEELRNLYEYGYWVNRRLFPVLSQITAEEFTKPLAGGHASIRNTLVHAMSAEWGWMDRCGGPPRGPALVPADYPSVAALVERWGQVETWMRGFLATLEDADLARIVEFSLGGGPAQAMPLGELMQHGAIHGVHHRGQVALLLRSLGHAPGNFDMLEYYRRNE